MATDDGGPAFPTYTPETNACCAFYEHGMSLRDYFAAKAVGGMLADPTVNPTPEVCSHLAASAYRVADAMLAARAKATG